MNSASFTRRHPFPLPAFLRNAWRNVRLRYYSKFVLPKITSTEIDGIHLDLTSFSPRIRNRILMGYEAAEKQICREFLRRDDSVLELGGGIGFIGLFCQKLLHVRNYVTVEANPQTIDILKHNYRLNGVIPKVLHYAISDRDGTITLNVSGDFWEHSLGTKQDTAQTIIVPSLTFGSLLKKIPICPNTLIIDVEGAERLINFREIPEEIKKIIIENHPVIIGEKSVQEIMETLESRGFRMVRQEGDTLAFTKK
jgi:FkbM family methyltransferase